MIEKKNKVLSDVDFEFTFFNVFLFCLYQNGDRKKLTCNGRCFSDMQYVYLICYYETKKDLKKKRITHQCLLNLTSWCFVTLKYDMFYSLNSICFGFGFLPVMLSRFNNEVSRLSVSVMNSHTWTIFDFRPYKLFFLFVFIPFSCS